METESKGNWYQALLTRVGQLAEALGLESEQREDLRAFVMEVAKTQYATGNKAGIRWLRVQMNKGGGESAQAA